MRELEPLPKGSAARAPAPAPATTNAEGLLLLAVALGGLFVAYKVGQALTDEDFGGRAYPSSFREELIGEHVRKHGSRCLRCDRRVPTRELSVDHIIPWARRGLTSRSNAAVLCRACNSAKGARVGWTEWLRGRAA